MASQRTLPPTSGYYTYGAANSEAYLEAQDDIELSKSRAKYSPKGGFHGFSVTDICAMITNFLVPLSIFAAVWLLISYNWHYKYELLDWILIAGIFIIVCFLGYTAARRMLQVADGSTDHLAVWAAALFVGVLLAFTLALAFGWRNYSHNMQQFYEIKELNSYTAVDASNMEGKAFMDAGTIKFLPGSHLDLGKSAGFMNLDMYCVAPIVTPGKNHSKIAKNATYDFWAIGLNCCTGSPDNFACGQSATIDTTAVTGGLRLMSNSQLPFYEMAVTQAATKYGIKSPHPVFFHWVQDAHKALSDYQRTGWDDFFLALFFFAVFEVVVVVLAAMGVMIVKSKYQ